jgi:hypothetical protein
MRSHSDSRTRRRCRIFRLCLGLLCLAVAIPVFATKGIFQGRVVEGTKHEAGKFIYVAGRSGYMRRVNIERCRVQFAAGVAASQRVRSAAESLRDSAEVRVTAEQSANGEWVATDILILKLPEADKVRLRI